LSLNPKLNSNLSPDSTPECARRSGLLEAARAGTSTALAAIPRSGRYPLGRSGGAQGISGRGITAGSSPTDSPAHDLPSARASASSFETSRFGHPSPRMKIERCWDHFPKQELARCCFFASWLDSLPSSRHCFASQPLPKSPLPHGIPKTKKKELP